MTEEKSDIETIVEDMTSPKAFNVIEAVTGRNYAQKSVRVYLDDATVRELLRKNEEMKYLANQEDRSEENLAKYEALEVETKELADKIVKSSLLFNMRGLDRGTHEGLKDESDAKHPDDEVAASHWWMFSILAKSIESIEDAEGNKDEHDLTVDEVETLYSHIPPDEWNKLQKTMQELTFAQGLFTQVVDAGFLPQP